MDMFYQDDAPYIEDEGKRTKTYFINISIPLDDVIPMLHYLS